jgi:4-hydroxyphenylacetate 3-monooxygenase
MLITGAQKLERMRDGRVVYVGGERVDDVTTHPAFARGAQVVADLYDRKLQQDKRSTFAYEEDGEWHSIWWMRPRTKEDLAKRMLGNKAVADETFGFFGRSPDHIGSVVTGLAMCPEILEELRAGCGENLMKYYKLARDNDFYLSYAVTPPSGLRSNSGPNDKPAVQPSLRVVREEADGVVISGMKMLATGAVFAESITCAIPMNLPGLSLWARHPYALNVENPLDYPLSYRFDETDCVLVCEEVKVPWERVFLHNNGVKSRAIYIESPANCLSNHQSNCRFWAKMALIIGVASKACTSNGVDKIPAVRDQLGRLAALEATIEALVRGQVDACESWPAGYVTPNRRMMYAALNWCQEHHTEIVDTLRTLMGGVPLQMPANVTVMDDPHLNELFTRWWSTPVLAADERMKLYKLGWDLTGSEFAGRHQLYEKFYAGHNALVRNSCDREAPWAMYHETVDRALEQASADAAKLKKATKSAISQGRSSEPTAA